MKIDYIRSFKDNYIWILYEIKYKKCIIIDPGNSKNIIFYIKNNKLEIEAVLLTHYHNDHILGVEDLYFLYKMPIYGPFKEKKRYPINFVKEGDFLQILGKKFYILDLPGHTINHIGYYCYPYLFCGDTMFSGGCGKIFEDGSYLEMYKSLNKINSLPKEIFIFSSHEYTENNLKFFLKILPKDKFVKKYLIYIKNKKKLNNPTLPSRLFLERRINIFLFYNKFKLKKSLNFSLKCNNYYSIFYKIRKLKDKFV